MRPFGFKCSEATKQKIRLSSIGKNKGKQPRLGAILSDETKRKIGLAHIGIKLSIAHRKKLSESHKGNQSRLGIKHTEATKRKIGLASKGNQYAAGENNGNWKGGISPINHSIRNSQEMKLWRESVFKRDNYTCVWCGLKGGWNKELKRRIILNADHIKSFALFPELRFALENGRTLCVECHKTTNTFGGKSKKVI